MRDDDRRGDRLASGLTLLGRDTPELPEATPLTETELAALGHYAEDRGLPPMAILGAFLNCRRQQIVPMATIGETADTPQRPDSTGKLNPTLRRGEQ